MNQVIYILNGLCIPLFTVDVLNFIEMQMISFALKIGISLALMITN